MQSSSNASSSRKQDKIKIEYMGDPKIVSKVTDYKKFINLVMQRYDEIGLAVKISGEKIDDLVKFTYNDRDMDVISISNDADLEEAFD